MSIGQTRFAPLPEEAKFLLCEKRKYSHWHWTRRRSFKRQRSFLRTVVEGKKEKDGTARGRGVARIMIEKMREEWKRGRGWEKHVGRSSRDVRSGNSSAMHSLWRVARVEGVGRESERERKRESRDRPHRGGAVPYMVKRARIGGGCPALIGRRTEWWRGSRRGRRSSYNTLRALLSTYTLCLVLDRSTVSAVVITGIRRPSSS